MVFSGSQNECKTHDENLATISSSHSDAHYTTTCRVVCVVVLVCVASAINTLNAHFKTPTLRHPSPPQPSTHLLVSALHSAVVVVFAFDACVKAAQYCAHRERGTHMHSIFIHDVAEWLSDVVMR